jgi:hypothetical protein
MENRYQDCFADMPEEDKPMEPTILILNGRSVVSFNDYDRLRAKLDEALAEHNVSDQLLADSKDKLKRADEWIAELERKIKVLEADTA